jgi:hypothetical protein
LPLVAITLQALREVSAALAAAAKPVKDARA